MQHVIVQKNRGLLNYRLSPYFIIKSTSFLYILLFTYAAISKIMEFTKFKVQLGQSPLLTAFATPTAFAIPTIEIIIAIMLATNKYRLVALYLSFSLMAMFTFYIVAILNFSEYIPCSCGGILQKMTWSDHLTFNILFLLLAFVAVLVYPGSKQNPSI